MKNVLIVDDEETLLLIIESRFEDYKDQFKVLTANNGKEAIDILESNVVDFVITDLNMPILDGIELLAHMSANYPTTPAIAMTAFSTPEVEEKLERMGTLRIMDKPVDLDVLAHTVLEGLARSYQGGTLTCISVSNFLQLINMEEKTCLVEVHSDGQKRGFLYFQQGELFDATFGDLKGEAACYEMIAWDNVQLYLKDLPQKKTKRRIKKKILSLVLEGLRLKDEAAEGEATKSAEPKPDPEKTEAYAIDELNQELENLKQEAVQESKKGPPDLQEPVKIVGQDQVEFIGKIFKIINSPRSHEELIPAVLKEVQTVIPFDFAAILAREKSRPEYLKVVELMTADKTTISKNSYHAFQDSVFVKALKQGAPTVIDREGSETDLLLLAAKKPGSFGGFQNMVAWIADGISFANQRQSLSAEIIKRKQALETIKRIGRALVSLEFDIDRVLKISMEAVRITMNVEAGSLMLRNADELKVAHSFNAKVKSLKTFRLKIGQGIAGYVAAKGKSLIVNDTRKSTQFFSGIDKITGFKTRSALCVPLVSQKKVAGVIQVLNKTDGDFVTGDEEFLLAIADAVSTAMEIARLYKKAVNTAEYEKDVRRTLQEFLVKGTPK
jgi:CheY-like chemotaxis protein/GAF domain-containing protein